MIDKPWYEKYRTILLILLGFGFIVYVSKLIPQETPQSNSTEKRNQSKKLYAIERCETYNGPSRESGRFFFKPTAKKALTLDQNWSYTVVMEQGDWIQVDVFGKTPWVERKCMVEILPEATRQTIYKERFEGFNKLQSQSNRKYIHAGAKQSGKELILFVTDKWHTLSPDMKEAYAKESMMLFMGIGGARQIKEKPEDYSLEIRHDRSNRLLATWDALWGFKLKE